MGRRGTYEIVIAANGEPMRRELKKSEADLKSWNASVDRMVARIEAGEKKAARSYATIAAAMKKLGAEAPLTERQLAKVRGEIERLERAGHPVPETLRKMFPPPDAAAAWRKEVDGVRASLARVTADEAAAARALQQLSQAVRELGGVEQLSARQLAHVREEVERLQRAGAKVVPLRLQPIMQGPPAPSRATADSARWQNDLSRVRTELRNLGRDETRALAALGKIVDEMGGLGKESKLSADQLAHVRREVERLSAAGGKAPASLASLVPGRPGGLGALGGELKAGLAAEFQSTAQSYAGGLGGIGTALSRVHPVALGVTAAAGGFVAIMAGGLGILRTWSSELLETAGRIQDLSVQTGFSTTTLQLWKAAGEQSGVPIETIAQASVKLAGSLAQGGATVTRAVAELGLSLDELRGMDPDAQFEAVAEAMARIQDPGKQAALTMQLFRDKSGVLLKVLRDDFRGAIDDARRFGVVLSQETIAKADRLGDKLTLLKGAWAGLKAEVAATVVTSPAALSAVEDATELVARYAKQVREAKAQELGLLGDLSHTPLLGSIGAMWQGAMAYADARLPDLAPPAPQQGRRGGMATMTSERFFAAGTATAAGRAAYFDTLPLSEEGQGAVQQEMDALEALRDEVTGLAAQHRSTYAGMVADIERTIAARRREALLAGNSGAQLAQIDRIRGLQIAAAQRTFVRGVLGEDAGDAAKAMRDLQEAVDLARQSGELTTTQYQTLGAALDAMARKGQQIPAALQGSLLGWRATSGPWGETAAAAPDIQAQYTALQETLQARLGAGTMTPGAWQAAAKDFEALEQRARAARVEVQGLRGDVDAVVLGADQARIEDALARAKEQLDRDLARGPDNVDVQAAAWGQYADTLARIQTEARGAGVAVAGLGQRARGAAGQAGAAKLTQEFNDLSESLGHLEEIGASSAAFSALLGQFEDLAERLRAAGLYAGDLDEKIARLTLRRDVSALSTLRATPLTERRGLVDQYLNLDAAFNPQAGGTAPRDRGEAVFYARALEQIYGEAREKGLDLEKDLPGLREELDRTFRTARLSTQGWQRSLDTVTSTLQVLGIEGSSAIGRIMGAIPAGGAATDGLIKVLQSPGGFSGWSKTALGNKLALGASVAQGAGALSTLFGGQSTTGGRFFGGAAMGAQLGALAGPWGAAIGGALGGAINAVFGAPWKGASRAAARFFGREVSDELAKAIDATADRLHTNAATASMLHISDVMQESGADPRHYAAQTVDLANAIKLGVLPAREGLTELGKAFSMIADEAERSGTAGDRALRMIIGRARELKLDVPEIRDYLSGQTETLIGAMGFIAASSTRQRDLFDREGNPLYRQDRAGNRVAVLDAEGNQATGPRGEPLYERATETIVEQTGGIQIATEADARAQGTIFGVAWATAVRQRGFVGAADALRQAFSNLTNTAGELGFDLSGVLGDIPALMDLTGENNPFRGAATGAQQLSDALKAVANEDIPLTGAQFAAFEEQAGRAFDQAKQAAIDKGYDAKAAEALGIEAVAPLLQRLVEVSRNYNMSLGEGTQNLLDMAQASDIAFRTDSTDRLIDAINALTKALGGIPPAAERAGGALDRLGGRDYGEDYGVPGAGTRGPVPPPRPGTFNPDSYTAAAGFGPLRLERDTIIHAHRGELAMVAPASAGALGFLTASGGFYDPLDLVGSDTADTTPFLGSLYGRPPQIDYRTLNLDRGFGSSGAGGVSDLGGAAAGEPLLQALAAGGGGEVSVGGPVLNATFNHGFVTMQEQREYMRQFERDLVRSFGRGIGPLHQAMVEALRRQGVRIGAQR